MAQSRAVEFLNNWTVENLSFLGGNEGVSPDELATRRLAVAKSLGIQEAAIVKAAGGNLAAYIVRAIARS